MKVKSTLLGVFSFMVAIGASIASSMWPENVYVHAKLRSDPDGETMCVNTDVLCDPSGTSVCTVILHVPGGFVTLNTANGDFRPYRATSSCQTEMTGTSDFPGGISPINTIERLLP